MIKTTPFEMVFIIRDSMDFIDEIYYTLLGDMLPAYAVVGVENAFAEGSFCDAACERIVAARQRIYNRLGVEEEDGDVETIIHGFLDIQQELCRKMFVCGKEYALAREDKKASVP